MKTAARAIGLLLCAPLAGFLLEAALGRGAFRFHAGAWGNTLLLSATTTLIALGLGVPVGVALAHTRRALPLALTLVPLLLPPVLGAAAWMGAGLPAPRSWLGCSLILGALAWPVVALILASSLRRLPADALDAAELQLTPSRTLRSVVWPHARPAILAAAFLVFLLAASEFTVPATFVVPAISMVIYEEMSAFRFASAASSALPLVAAAIGLAFVLRKAPLLPSPAPGRPFLRGTPLRAAWVAAGIVWTLTAAAPAVVFAADIGSARGFWNAVAPNAGAMAWSAATCGIAAGLLVLWASMSARRSRLEPLWLAALVLPGVVAGLGALRLAGRLEIQWIVAPSGALLVLALMSRFAAAAWWPMRDPVDPAQIEAAELSGLSPFRIWRKIVWPAALPRALAVGAILFLLALGEIGPAVLLSPPGRQTGAQQVFNWMHYGYDETVASVALLQFGAIALVTWGGLHAGRLLKTRSAG